VIALWWALGLLFGAVVLVGLLWALWQLVAGFDEDEPPCREPWERDE